MPRATIRFPEDLHSAISAEAERRGKPWTFSSVLVEYAANGRALRDANLELDEACSGEIRIDPSIWTDGDGQTWLRFEDGKVLPVASRPGWVSVELPADTP